MHGDWDGGGVEMEVGREMGRRQVEIRRGRWEREGLRWDLTGRG